MFLSLLFIYFLLLLSLDGRHNTQSYRNRRFCGSETTKDTRKEATSSKSQFQRIFSLFFFTCLIVNDSWALLCMMSCLYATHNLKIRRAMKLSSFVFVVVFCVTACLGLLQGDNLKKFNDGEEKILCNSIVYSPLNSKLCILTLC